MSITPLGLILIPLSLFIFYFRPKYLISWAIIVSAFQAASVVNIGGDFAIGVSPYFFVVSLVAIRFAAACLQGRLSFKHGDMALDITRPLLMLAAWGVASALSVTPSIRRHTRRYASPGHGSCVDYAFGVEHEQCRPGGILDLE